MSQSLERGLTVLTELAAGPQTLDELAEALGVHKSTAMRLLRTLEASRFVRRDGVHHYRLGTVLFDLANRALEGLDVRSASQPHLSALGESTGHTIHLATFEDDQVVYIDKVDSRHPVRMYSRVGKSAPLHCTAVGKALVAEWSRDRRADLARRISYPKLTENTLTSPAEFLAELEQVRTQGHAFDRSEHEDFIHCIGAPIRDNRGDVVAAMSLSAPKVLLDFDGLVALVDDLLLATHNVSTELGWHGAHQESTSDGKEH